MVTQLQLCLLIAASLQLGHAKKCDQTPPQATIPEPSENKGVFKMIIETKMQNLSYLPDQTYVVTLMSNSPTRPFRWFMITAEDPDMDNSTFEVGRSPTDVGRLKTLDTETGRKSRYSERCFNSVENMDNSEKYRVDIHWISPKSREKEKEQNVRLRAMVAENEESWYIDDEDLIILLHKDNRPPIDSPPTIPIDPCNLCSEARYEVIFNGQWSRVSHPHQYPSKPDDNGYTHMVGASHSSNFTLWKQDEEASPGLTRLVEAADPTELEREIISMMKERDGTRTLIRGKRRHHPFMFEPSHSLFRVDRYHHRFSLVVGMRPSPDWFLGTSHFELCTPSGWWESAQIPLYPFDAGTMDGVSYESPKYVTTPKDHVKRVEVGSFNKESPFYQMNLNDLKPFAILKVRLLDVYPLENEECSEDESEAEEDEQTQEENEEEEEAQDEPLVAESRQNLKACFGDWSEWSPCAPYAGYCGLGTQTRSRKKQHSANTLDDNCNEPESDRQPQANFYQEIDVQNQHCFVECQ